MTVRCFQAGLTAIIKKDDMFRRTFLIGAAALLTARVLRIPKAQAQPAKKAPAPPEEPEPFLLPDFVKGKDKLIAAALRILKAYGVETHPDRLLFEHFDNPSKASTVIMDETPVKAGGDTYPLVELGMGHGEKITFDGKTYSSGERSIGFNFVAPENPDKEIGPDNPRKIPTNLVIYEKRDAKGPGDIFFQLERGNIPQADGSVLNIHISLAAKTDGTGMMKLLEAAAPETFFVSKTYPDGKTITTTFKAPNAYWITSTDGITSPILNEGERFRIKIEIAGHAARAKEYIRDFYGLITEDAIGLFEKPVAPQKSPTMPIAPSVPLTASYPGRHPLDGLPKPNRSLLLQATP